MWNFPFHIRKSAASWILGRRSQKGDGTELVMFACFDVFESCVYPAESKAR